MMAKKSPAAEVVELEELEELEEAATPAAESGEGMLTAKAAATKLGTDGKTLRKFLRSQHGTVGQGKRWEINEDDIAQLKVDFAAWGTGKTKKEPKEKSSEPKKKPAAKNKELDAIPEPDDDAIMDLDMDDDIEDLDD